MAKKTPKEVEVLPKISYSEWLALRKAGTVTKAALMAALGPGNAFKTSYPTLQKRGLIDEQWTITELGKKVLACSLSSA